ncbi:MAG: hypothetical protein K9I94_12670 [Bacteroidales bacterium]|nr:hypothetical protein [Bacteroidales bacterium]
MKTKDGLCTLLIIFLVFQMYTLKGQPSSDSANFISRALNDVTFSGQWFLGYQHLENPTGSANAFTLKRGYITFKKSINPNISVRFTQDITLDKEGSDAGNIEMRLKYCYLKLSPPGMDIFKHSYVELGLVHRPWIDFEQDINRYRVQGKMFLERNRLINSADFGITYVSLLGGMIGKNYREKVNEDFPGKYGSIVLGIYNGSGYHDIEENKNKTFEGRLSIRPLPSSFPGLQLSYNFAYGKGNIPENPDFFLNHAFISYQSPYAVLTGQYYSSKGNAAGTYIDKDYTALRSDGYSFFVELKDPKSEIAIFGRYDNFTYDGFTTTRNHSIIGGLSYSFAGMNKIVLDIDYAKTPSGIYRVYETAIEIKF